MTGPGNGNGNVSGTPRRQRQQGLSRNGEPRCFDAYMTIDQVQRGLRRGELIEVRPQDAKMDLLR